jgi:predicted unusual protein kinase regulating ubiquinone biosynthesis (AarF/ABC1/UbiB family)
MSRYVDDAVRSRQMKIPPTYLLLRHCLTLGEGGQRRRPAQVRLEEALGPELARRLVLSLAPAEGARRL